MAAGQHQRIDPARAVLRNDRAAGGHVETAAHEKTARHRQLPTAHCNRALMEIEPERVLHRVRQVAERFDIVGKRDFPKAGFLFGMGDLL